MNKTKFFSSLLVAVLFATTSVFVSCKDYDDDIKNLQSQIDKAALKADLDALSTKLAGVETTANAAKTTAENALAKANANKTEIDNVKATADKAAADAAEGLAAVAKAQNTADAAQAAAAAAQKTADNAAAAAAAAQKTADAAATKKELEDAVAKLQKAVDDLAAVAATKQELADAKTELQAYAKAQADAAKEVALAAAKAAADAAAAAQKTADDATAAAGKAQSTADQNAETIKTLATQTAVETLSSELKGEIEGLKTTLAAITDKEKMEELVKIVGSFDTIVEKLFSAVTSVELLASYSGTLDDTNEAIQFPLSQFLRHQDQGSNLYLPFYFGKQKFTSKFGDKETESLFKDADEIIEYTEGVDIRAKQALLVRVNPVNATFTKEDVKLIDSKGRNLDEIITIGDPYRYEGLITRGATTETGLWVIPVSVKENTQLKDFNVVTYNEREYYTVETYKQDNAGATDEDAQEAVENNAIRVPGDGILYAVAINNTADEADGRFVASTYDVEAQYVNFEPESTISFFLTTENSKGEKNEAYWYNIHNRWAQGNYINSYTNEGNKPGILSWDQKNSSNKSLTAYTLENPEQAWSLSSDAKKAGWSIPVDVAKKSQNDDEKVYDTANDGDDYRYARSFFYIEKVGQKITVELPDYYKTKAEYWYITYDFQANAVESAPSEWEAWKSYQDGIKGIYTMTRGAQTIDLVINKAEAQGDVIGFRVWAVNYDGSLLDPDGKAFYVKVGEEPEAQKLEISASFMAVDASKDMNYSYLSGDDSETKYIATKGYNVSAVTPVNGNEFESLALPSYQANNYAWVYDKDITPNSVRVYYALLKSDKKSLATNWNEIAYIKVGVSGSDLVNIKDGETLTLYPITAVRTDANNKEKYQIDIKVTKQMPDEAWTTKNHYDGKFTWKSDYNPATGELTVYPKAIPVQQHTQLYVAADKEFFWNNQNALKDAYAEADWKQVATDAQRMIKDYLSSTTLSDGELANYEFTLSKLPTSLTGSKEPKNADYFTAWTVATADAPVIAGNTMMTVEPSAINNSYNTTMSYVYKNISLTGEADDNGDMVWDAEHDKAVAINGFKKVTFKDAMELMQYNTEYETLRYYVTASGDVIYDPAQIGNSSATMVSKTDNNVYIKWESDVKAANKNPGDEITNLYRIKRAGYNTSNALPPLTFNPDTYDFDARISVAVADLTGVFVTTTKQSDAARVLMRDAGITADLADASFAFTPAWFKFQKNNDGVLSAGDLKFEITGDAKTYIKVAEGATLDHFKYTRTGWNNNANPTENISGAIKISGYDAFGVARSFEIPLVIKHNL
jgi:hypothetical protein